MVVCALAESLILYLHPQPSTDPMVRRVVVLLYPRGVCAMHVHLVREVHLMCQPPLVLLEWSRLEVVRVAMRRMVERREWSRQVAYRMVEGKSVRGRP
jgi:hypothetical protein